MIQYSQYRMGLILLMFDLPVVDIEERRKASKFRNQLLDFGFSMLQESVYVRYWTGYDQMEKHLKRVQSVAPQRGSIIAFFITDRQWKDSNNAILKTNQYRYNRSKTVSVGEELGEQMKFW